MILLKQCMLFVMETNTQFNCEGILFL